MISACAGVDDVADRFLAGLIAQRLGVICRRLGITFARASGRLRGQGMRPALVFRCATLANREDRWKSTAGKIGWLDLVATRTGAIDSTAEDDT